MVTFLFVDGAVAREPRTILSKESQALAAKLIA
jgi:hypothetical protein